MNNKYKTYQFGDGGHENYVSVVARSLDYAVKIFKLERLWPEQYVGKKWRVGSKERNEAGVWVYKTKPGAKIPVWEINNEGKDKKVLELDLIDCINVDYDTQREIKYLPEQKEENDENGEEGEDNKRLEIYARVRETMTGKMKARERMIEINKLKDELEAKIEDLDYEVRKFEEAISAKKKQLFAIETYLGMYEEVLGLKTGKRADDKERIAIYQQKCYMDEEMGLTEVDGYAFKQGLDSGDIEEFDKWITKNYEKYLYKEKSVMAWEVRRYDKRYTDNWYGNKVENEENHRTYFLMRNGENLYRIYSGVRTPDRIYPSLKEIEKVLETDGTAGRGEDYQRFVEERIYVYIALQGIIDRTEVFGTSLRGKVNFINPKAKNEEHIELIRDAEYEYYVTDGKKRWNEYLRDNQKTIKTGVRVLKNDAYNYWYLSGKESKKERDEDRMNGKVYIVEDEKKSGARGEVGDVIKSWGKVLEIIRKLDGKSEKSEKLLDKINEEFDENKLGVYASVGKKTRETGKSILESFKGLLLTCYGVDLNIDDDSGNNYKEFTQVLRQY